MRKPKDKKAFSQFRAVALNPSQVQVAPNAFCDPDGAALPPLSLEAVGAEARGVVVVSPEQALRFLMDNKVLSVDSLALLTLSVVTPPVDCALHVVGLTWPGLHMDSQEPLLIRGSCVQLGDLRVTPKHGKLVAPAVETDLFRLFLYQDQWPGSWSEVVAGPLKALIGWFGPLQLCGHGCSADCNKFDPAVEEEGINMVVLDAFSWRWMDGKGKPVPAARAVAFSIMIRIPRSGTLALLNLSGADGLYTELRDSEQMVSHSKYAVIWLKDEHAAAMRKVCSVPNALHLVRFHTKYGVRCLKVNEPEVFSALFPDRHFVACAVPLQYEMGPWPYGITRQAIANAMDCQTLASCQRWCAGSVLANWCGIQSSLHCCGAH